MRKKSILTLSVLLLAATTTSCGVKPQNIAGKVTDLKVTTTITVDEEEETKKYGLTTVPFGAKVLKTHPHNRKIQVCGTSKSRSTSKSKPTAPSRKSSTSTSKKTTPTPTTNNNRNNNTTNTNGSKSTGINLNKAKQVPTSTTNSPKITNKTPAPTTKVTPPKPCSEKTETYYTYDVETEYWDYYKTFTSDTFTPPALPQYILDDGGDDYKVHDAVTTCKVTIAGTNLVDVTLQNCNQWRTLKVGDTIQGEYTPFGGLVIHNKK